MNKFFGTDGIRGEFGKKLTIDLSLDVAIAASNVLKKTKKRPLICIARDTRESSRAIENALVAGFSSSGVDVVLLGVTTTPNISYLITRDDSKYDAGVMISASHNPYYDNGIKFFGSNGKKLSDELEEQIEQYLHQEYEMTSVTDLGSISVDKEGVEQYMDYLVSFSEDLSGLKIGLDCANGSSYDIAKKIFERCNAQVHVIGDQPNGKNINDNVGSTHPEQLSELVIKKQLDFGLAFDGDGDRVMLIDNKGEVLDGDYMIYLLTEYLKEHGQLKNNIVIGTVMSNIGFKLAIDELGVKYEEAQVGDRFVMQKMEEFDAAIGGEQSGHIILADYLPTGDGLLSGLLMANIINEDIDYLKNLTKTVNKYPQKLVNMQVVDKNEIMKNEEFLEIIAIQEQKLQKNGRILVRASGTENLVRVMIEAKDEKQCEEFITPIIDFIKKINSLKGL